MQVRKPHKPRKSHALTVSLGNRFPCTLRKVNYRGSAGFGKVWRASRGFAEDISRAIEWAMVERKVLGEAPAGELAAVALLGSYFGAYAALHTASRLRDWTACLVAIAPQQVAPGGVWSEPYFPGQSTESDDNLEPAGLVGDLQGLAMMLVEYERDDANGPLALNLVPVGCDPEDWPRSLQYVQYAGERKGGGVVRQNMLDLYRRMDSFLHEQLSGLTGQDCLTRSSLQRSSEFSAKDREVCAKRASSTRCPSCRQLFCLQRWDPARLRQRALRWAWRPCCERQRVAQWHKDGCSFTRVTCHGL